MWTVWLQTSVHFARISVFVLSEYDFKSIEAFAWRDEGPFSASARQYSSVALKSTNAARFSHVTFPWTEGCVLPDDFSLRGGFFSGLYDSSPGSMILLPAL